MFLNLNYNHRFFFNFFFFPFKRQPFFFRTGSPISARNLNTGHLSIALQMKSNLLDLVELKNAGAITEDEFVASKRELFTPAVSTSSTTPVMRANERNYEIQTD